jgi:hypothetical protein
MDTNAPADLMPTRNLGNPGARLISLSHNSKLISHRPAVAPLNTRNYLKPHHCPRTHERP